MMPGSAAHNAVAASSEGTLQHGRDVSSSLSASGENSFPPSGVSGVSGESCSSDQPTPSSGQNVSSVGSFSDVVHGAQPDPIEVVPDVDNELPSRPLTVFFNPRAQLPANEVFTALQAAKIENKDISCIQRQSSGEIVLTFRNIRAKEQFLTNNVVKIRDQPFALQDVDRPLTYVQVSMPRMRCLIPLFSSDLQNIVMLSTSVVAISVKKVGNMFKMVYDIIASVLSDPSLISSVLAEFKFIFVMRANRVPAATAIRPATMSMRVIPSSVTTVKSSAISLLTAPTKFRVTFVNNLITARKPVLSPGRAMLNVRAHPNVRIHLKKVV